MPNKTVQQHLHSFWKNLEKQWKGLDYAHTCLLSLFFAVKNTMTLTKAKATDEFPADLAAVLAGEDIEVQMQCTWGDFFWFGLPPASRTLLGFPEELGLKMLDDLKLNLLPVRCNPPDILLDLVGRQQGCQWQHLHLKTVILRRCWNEGFHVLCAFSLLRYMQSGKLKIDATAACAESYLLKAGFCNAADILLALRHFWEHEDRFYAAFTLTVEIAGIMPRGGYCTPRMENSKKGADPLQALFKYISGPYKIWKDAHSFAQSFAEPPFKTLRSFQLYQVDMKMQDHAILKNAACRNHLSAG